MKNKKNIDRLFQERFKDFETEPNEHTWSNIQAALKEEKKERKVIPLWLKYTGIAAAFFLGFFALNSVFKTNNDSKNSIVLETKSSNSSTDNKDTVPTKTMGEKNQIYLKNNSKIALTDPEKTKKNEKETTAVIQSKITLGKTKNQNIAKIYIGKNNPSLEKADTKNENLKSDLAVAEKNNPKNSTLSDNILNQNIKKELLKEKENSAIAKTDSDKQALTSAAVPNELEALLKTKEEEKNKIVAARKNKWEITPNIAAMYPNANSNGSSIDPQFSENSKTTENSLGFGVGINYAISKKMALRSGINKFSLGYNTNNVVYSTGLKNNNLANVNYTTNALIEVHNSSNLNSLMTFEKNLQKTSSGTINQKMGYYEVPLELSYAILDKKIGINIIGGISTLFLEENKISLISSEANLKLGEANNLNSVHFSTNFGIGFQYKFVKSFQLNFEPMVKYQLNTFSNNSGNFKPVLIGLYSGISYHF
ncbi:hypothetical protein ACMDB5_04175 [Flavobacterium sp. W1B]|uniref:hypothetical protein n=1 Tax=Flavobacterium sp. W1B TaxID=3394146 RepID=UPI0039BD6911